jgi:hypothetical protein
MSRRFGLWVVVGALTLAAPPAHASHIPGGTYRGTAATGGTVEFDVSADGASITRFVATDVRDNCGASLAKSFAGSLPIVDHAFSSDPADPIRFDGSFPSSGQAAGRLVRSSCANPAVSWTAATGAAVAPPPPSPPDTTPPALAVRAARSQPLRRGGAIRIRVRCPDEACRAVAGGSLSVAGDGTARFRLRRASAQLARGGSVRLEPRLGRRALAAARGALRDGRRVTVRVAIAAVDAAGNRTVKRLSIRPRLPR